MILLWLMALIFGDGGTATVRVPTEAELRVAVERWQREVNFTSTYRFTRGFARSSEQALRGETDPALGRALHPARGIFNKPGRAFRATGVLNKWGPSLLLTFDPGVAGICYKKGDFTLEPVIEASNGVLALRYFPRRFELYGEEVKNVHIRRRAGDVEAPWAPGAMTAGLPTPLHPLLGGPGPLPFAGLSVARISRLDAAHLEALCEGTREIGLDAEGKALVASVHRRVVFLTEKGTPVVCRIEETIDRFPSRGPPTRDKFVTVAEGFRECPGGRVARQVRCIAMQQDDVIRVFDWISDDLGNRPPTAGDFAVEVPEDVPVRGLSKGYEPGSVRAIRLDDIDPADVLPEPPPTVPSFTLLNTEGLKTLFTSWAVGISLFAAIAGWYRFRQAVT
jgi:hypothetical protein